MKIRINGEENDFFEEGTSVSEILLRSNVEMPDMVSVQLNGEFVGKTEYETTTVKENDEVDFLYFMGGGER